MQETNIYINYELLNDDSFDTKNISAVLLRIVNEHKEMKLHVFSRETLFDKKGKLVDNRLPESVAIEYLVVNSINNYKTNVGNTEVLLDNNTRTLRAWKEKGGVAIWYGDIKEAKNWDDLVIEPWLAYELLPFEIRMLTYNISSRKYSTVKYRRDKG